MSDHNVTYEIAKTTDGVAEVTFTCGDTSITHERNVTVSDCADDAAVAQRMSEVAAGVAVKIAVGVISAPDEGSEEDTAE